MKKQFKMQELKLKSFITQFNERTSKTIKGGHVTDNNVCGSVGPCDTISHGGYVPDYDD